MSKATIIEVDQRTAGIVTGEGRGVTFFSSDRAFDRLEGQNFRSARDAERAVRAVLNERNVIHHDMPLLPAI